jgi:hypothetical protein
LNKKIVAFVMFSALSLFSAFDGMKGVYAQAQENITITAQAGLNGFCKSGTWLPVHVTVENVGADVEARVQASYKNDMNGQTVYGTDISLPATSRKEFFLYVYPDGSMRNFTVSVLDGNKTLAKTNLNVNCEFDPVTFFGVLADDPSAYNVLNDIHPLAGTVRVAQLKVSDLPDRAQGWSALDALVISNMDTGTLTAGQKQALELWLANGGKLFVTGGVHWQATTAGLNDFLPIELKSTKNITGLSALSTYSKDESLLEEGTVLATGQIQEDANVLVEQDGIPLLIEKQIGFGKVFYFAADPNLRPLSDWGGMKEIYSHLLGFKSPKPVWADASWDSAQANGALATLPELSLPSFIYICCWLGVYVSVIGPLNYFVLRRMKRTELAWVTVPVLVILFTSLAYFSGYAYRGTRPILNRIMLAQGWEGVGQTQVNALIGVYSPSRTSYTVETQDQFMLYPSQNTNTNLQSNDNWLSIKNETGTILPDVRVEIGGMQSIGTSGSMPALTIQHDLVLTLSDQTPTLTGMITNTGNYTISDAVLVTPSGWKVLGDLPPNKTTKLNITLTNNSSVSSTSQYTIMTTLGMDTYAYSNKDTDQRRRASFFQANINSSSGNIHVNSGIYLMGWVDEIPAPVGLQDQSFKSMDTMLFFEKLTPTLKPESGNLMLTSSIYAWESSLGDTITTAYYNLSNGGYTMRFQPSLPVHFSKVDSLSLNIEGSVTPDKIQVMLWNFENNNWTLIPMKYYSTDVAEAWQYVGMDGEIRLNINGDPNDYVEITAVDFTLMVQP